MWKAVDWSARLGMSVPIVQGPFGGGLSSVELTATVSDSGGLGSFGAHHLTGEHLLATASNRCASTGCTTPRRRATAPASAPAWGTSAPSTTL